jgi:hypothetical protein
LAAAARGVRNVSPSPLGPSSVWTRFDERNIGIRADMHRFDPGHAHFRPPLDDAQPPTRAGGLVPSFAAVMLEFEKYDWIPIGSSPYRRTRNPSAQYREMIMGVLVSHTPLQFAAHARISAGRSSSPDHRASSRDEGSTTASGLPASAYWTAYDHYMIEREARVYRRAYVCSALTTFVRQLQQSILNFRPGRA